MSRSSPKWGLRRSLSISSVSVCLVVAGVVAANALTNGPTKPGSAELTQHSKRAAAEGGARKPIEVVTDSLRELTSSQLSDGYIVQVTEGVNSLGEERIYILLRAPDPEVDGAWLPVSASDIPRLGEPIVEMVQPPTGPTALVFADLNAGSYIELLDDTHRVGLIEPTANDGVVEVSVEFRTLVVSNRPDAGGGMEK